MELIYNIPFLSGFSSFLYVIFLVSEERHFFCSSEMLSNHYKNEILVLKGEFTNLFSYSDLMLVKQVKLSLVC